MYVNNLPARLATLKHPTLVVLGGLNTCILNCMQSFSPSRTVWHTCPSMPVDSLAWFSVSVIANTLYVIGGIKVSFLFEFFKIDTKLEYYLKRFSVFIYFDFFLMIASNH